MDFARQQRDPTRHLIGITFVIVLHALILWAMVSGLARKAVEVIKKPITATIIEEIKAPPPPPPPPKKVVEQPKTQAPQETYVPPPDIPVQSTQEAPVISATTTAAPTEPHVIAPPPVVQAPPAPPAPRPAVRQGVSCHDMEKPTFPREARRAGVDKGEVNVLMQIDEQGNVIDVKIVSADPPKVFDRATLEALLNWKGKAEGEKYYATVQVGFRIE